jgi:hypothetical protein
MISEIPMDLLRQARLRILTLLMVATALLPARAFGHAPCDGLYTYRYGYNPGYYGSSICPRDPGAKLGQAIVPMHNQYRYIPRKLQRRDRCLGQLGVRTD